MQHKKKVILPVILIVCCLVLHVYSSDPARVENSYSAGFFPVISNFLRVIFGWFPFSIGDILYGAAFIFLARKLIQLFKFIFRKKQQGARQHFYAELRQVLIAGCFVYLVFNIFWGINYNRIGIAGQLHLEIKEFSARELKNINAVLIKKINSSKIALMRNKTPFPSNSALFQMTADAYNNIKKKYSFLQYKNASLKPSLWGWIGNYTGFTGYYNPFTGEAQVNTTVPRFTQPFTACHEAAHQLGYAKEMEANFVGYLAAAASPDTVFHYSVYTDLFLYANRTLYFADSASALECRKMLLPEVLADFKERKKFFLDHESFAEPAIQFIYSKFLQSNQQPMGILSYDEVTGFIIAYYKKFGTL